MKQKQTTAEIMRAFQKAAPYLNMIYTFFGSVIFFGVLGYSADKHFDTRPIFIVSGVALGFGLGFYQMMKILKELEKKDD